MALPTNLQVAELVVKGKIDGQDYINRLHFGTVTTEWDTNGLTLLAQLTDGVSQAFVESMLIHLSNQFTFVETEAKRIAPDVSDSVVNTDGAGPGGIAGQALPSFNSMLIHKKSGQGGRKGRGRMFMPPPLESHVALGLLSQAAIDALEDYIADLGGRYVQPAGTSVWELGVLRNIYGPPQPPNNHRDITDRFWYPTRTLAADPLVAVQRRRKIGKGS